MTQKLQELLNLAEPSDLGIDESESMMATIEENQQLLADTDEVVDRINNALPSVRNLDTTDEELDELSLLAKEKFQDLMDLGMNVESRFSGPILATASMLLGHAITAKQAKIDRKLKTIDLQLKKAKLDLASQKTDGEKILDAEDGQGVVMDRNELIKQLIAAAKK
jgi:hypothetical protein